jgi:hypothetical protein
MLKKVVKSIAPPAAVSISRKLLGKRDEPVGTAGSLADSLEHEIEVVDFWSNTSLYALQVIQQHGDLRNMKLLSIGNRMANLADYLAVFGTIYHSTLLNTLVPDSSLLSSGTLKILKEDFFALPEMDVDCVISQAAIHCLNDTRYGNEGNLSGWERPYQAGAKLRQILGGKSVPVVVSIAAHKTESLIDDNARLAHDKFVRSFTDVGFSLKDYFFDYLCYGMPARREYLEAEYRRSKELPDDAVAPNEYHYAIGNYYFL